ncbi:MAG: hypothetical protein IJ318_02255 [Clostridia bacterium]|nr:hypothetical protein [Clostridia bacterium]
MSSISSWVLSIAGVCVLSVVADLILPEGKTNHVIKNVFSYVVILVAISPIPSLINGNWSLDGLFSSVEFEIQDEYIYNLNQAKLDGWVSSIEVGLEEKGIVGAVVSISANIFEQDMQIEAVYVDLYNAVISSNLQNTNIQTEVVGVVLEFINIDKSKVTIYE